MHPNMDLLLTLTFGLTAALVLGYFTQRLGLSPIVGYLLAGIVVGPATPGFHADQKLAEQLAEVGVILLMFGVGLHFHFSELLAVRRIAVPGAVGQSLLATALGVVAGWAFGWGWTAGLVFGLAISVASTVVLVRVLADHNDLHSPAGHIAVGWLVVEDIFTVVVLVVLPALFGKETGGLSQMPVELGLAALKIGLLVAFTFLVGGRVIPWLLARVAATRSRELFTLTVLAVALGIAVGSATLFGVSMALGAFLAGMVVGRSDFSLRAASEALPMRDAFAVLFFVSAGMLLDPAFLWEAPGVVMVTLGIILLGKPLAALLIVRYLGYPVKTALSVSVALAQIGEFSFILAVLGKQLGLVPTPANQALVVGAILSISLNPLLYRGIDSMEGWAKRRPRLWRWLNSRVRQHLAEETKRDDVAEEPPSHQAIVVGYGPVGRTLVRLLQENGVGATIIELNLETVRRLREHGLRAVYGDATHQQTVLEAGAAQAVALILSSSGMHGSAEAIRLVREVNPQIKVFARATYLREIPALRQAGADAVFSGEGEVALAMTESLLRGLGASGEQIDRERDRIREELFGTPLAIEILLPPPLRKEAQGSSDGQLSPSSNSGQSYQPKENADDSSRPI
jgi:monovalent cation:H+ antiporter-2, CPA2 family